MNSDPDLKQITPPKFAEKFVKWCLPKELETPVLGDLAEEYLQLTGSQPFKANYWYTRQALHTGLQFLTKTKRGLMMFLLGILVFAGVVVMAMIMSSTPWLFINVPSLIVVVPPAILLTMASSSRQSRKDAVSIIFSDSIALSKVEMLRTKQVYTTFGNMNMLMGWIGVVIGAVAIANNINGDNFSDVFGPAFAVCVLTLFYALLIKALCYAAEAKIQSKILALEPSE